ncbi:MAG: hypothetical protein M5R36_01470 [Deltaproteobacteria bacterium]|nr:hypothetical protein [Deltaproteobacteria bacterium]
MSAGRVTIFDRCVPPSPPPGDAIYFAPPGAPFSLGKKVSNPAPTSWDDEHPAVQHVHLEQLVIHEARPIHPASGDLVLMGHYDDALILERKTGSARALAVAFALDATDFPMHGAFPIFLHNAVWAYARAEAAGHDGTARVGDLIVWKTESGAEKNNGDRPRRKNRKSWRCVRGRRRSRPAVPGFYKIDDGGDTHLVAAGLLSPEESDLAVADGAAVPEWTNETKTKRAALPWTWLVIAAMALSRR